MSGGSGEERGDMGDTVGKGGKVLMEGGVDEKGRWGDGITVGK